jgi:hypothetical protein
VRGLSRFFFGSIGAHPSHKSHQASTDLDNAASLLLNLEIRSRQHVVSARLKFLDAHLF